MSDDCCKGGSCEAEKDCCSGKAESECGGHSCGGCGMPEEIDVKALGPEAEELAKKFDEVNVGLVNALKARKEILELIYKNAQSPDMKEKMDKVLASRHPVLIQFVFGQ